MEKKTYIKLESFDFKMCPKSLESADEKALKIGGVTRDRLKMYKPSIEMFVKFKEMLDKYVSRFDKKDKLHFAAYNSPFDEKFVRSWFRNHGDNYYGSYFWVPSIDVMTLAGARLLNRRPSMKNFKLATVVETLGIAVIQGLLHDAIYDVYVTLEVFKKLFGLTEETVKDQEK
jgi:DNA polymerase-3 subunit epsilon